MQGPCQVYSCFGVPLKVPLAYCSGRSHPRGRHLPTACNKILENHGLGRKLDSGQGCGLRSADIRTLQAVLASYVFCTLAGGKASAHDELKTNPETPSSRWPKDPPEIHPRSPQNCPSITCKDLARKGLPRHHPKIRPAVQGSCKNQPKLPPPFQDHLPPPP